MKIRILLKSLCMAILVIFVASTLNAQVEPTPAPKTKSDKVTEYYDQHTDELATQLTLTEDQKGKFKQIDEQYASRIKTAIDAKKGEDLVLREEKMKAKRALLTPAQATKYDEIAAKKKADFETKKMDKPDNNSPNNNR